MAVKPSETPAYILAKQRQAWQANPSPSVAHRKGQLQQLKQILIKHEKRWIEALVSDMKRAPFEAFTFEIGVLLNEIDYVCAHLHQWMRPSRRSQLRLGYRSNLQKERAPYGCVLVISPWNYPLQLALMPVIGAIAAGNRCIIKPSEHAPATGQALQELIAANFPQEVLAVVTGDAQIAKELTSLPFDLIFFTGGEQTGRAVAQQAARQLTPVILELGGKNPCILEESGLSPQAIREIVWGKFANAGQTCIAPDTLFVHHHIYEQTLLDLKDALISLYGEAPQHNQDYAAICHPGHFERLLAFLPQGQVKYGGEYNAKQLFLAPTIMTDLKADSSIWTEEIFGPILPVIPYTDLEALLESGQLQRDALAGYIFSKHKRHIRRFQSYMRSTTISTNQVIQYAANPHISFGGIGRSGHGSYHGEAGFRTFSYEKSLYTASSHLFASYKYPPYRDENINILRRLRKWIL